MAAAFPRPKPSAPARAKASALPQWATQLLALREYGTPDGAAKAHATKGHNSPGGPTDSTATQAMSKTEVDLAKVVVSERLEQVKAEGNKAAERAFSVADAVLNGQGYLYGKSVLSSAKSAIDEWKGEAEKEGDNTAILGFNAAMKALDGELKLYESRPEWAGKMLSLKTAMLLPSYLASAESLLKGAFCPTEKQAAAPVKATESEGKGKVLDIVVIETGMSKNGREYPPETLKASVALFEDLNVYMHTFDQELHDHLPDEVRSSYPNGVAGSLVGYLKNARYEESDGKGMVVADFHCVDPRLSEIFSNLIEAKRLDKLGFSIDVEGTVSEGQPIHGVPTKRVDSIDKAYALDVVTYPAAGGRVRGPKAS